MQRFFTLTLLLLGLAACDNFTPHEKVADYDPVAHDVTPPHPCPDWSQTQTFNYDNEVHSNFGCAVNNNMSIQLDDPQDLVRGHGNNHPDTGITTGVIGDYRAGKIPLPLKPQEDSGAGGASSGGGGS